MGCVNRSIVISTVLVATVLIFYTFCESDVIQKQSDTNLVVSIVPQEKINASILSRKARMTMGKALMERQFIKDRRAIIIRCCGMESCTNVPLRRKIIIKRKKKKTTTPSEYEDGETSISGEETTSSEETTAGGETTASEETTVSSEETTVETTTIDANVTTTNPNATTLHTNSTTHGKHNSTRTTITTIHPNSTTKVTTPTTATFSTVNGTISTTTIASTSTISTTTSNASLTTSTASTTTIITFSTTTPAPNCSADTCLAINCSQSNPQPSSSEVQVSSVLNGNPIPRRMTFSIGETCNKAYKIISGSATGNYESAFRVCCLLKMNVLSIDTPDKFTCISSMLKSMGSMSWYVWTSARQRKCNGSYVWCSNPWTEVNASLWSPGFPVAYNASTNDAPCVSLNVNYVNNTAVTTLENSACDFMNTIICEVQH
ncbi:Hypothetical predicted protein [Cloeon dipterum]|uniref:C-type lectin domain-containing protein n=1 Tax=Cloeon dipterum TaxID=197152 RepID=A0A8S1CSY7_9INSE|nr:Hypothetical predicted protein [Cloeon dipterum]